MFKWFVIKLLNPDKQKNVGELCKLAANSQMLLALLHMSCRTVIDCLEIKLVNIGLVFVDFIIVYLIGLYYARILLWYVYSGIYLIICVNNPSKLYW